MPTRIFYSTDGQIWLIVNDCRGEMLKFCPTRVGKDWGPQGTWESVFWDLNPSLATKGPASGKHSSLWERDYEVRGGSSLNGFVSIHLSSHPSLICSLKTFQGRGLFCLAGIGQVGERNTLCSNQKVSFGLPGGSSLQFMCVALSSMRSLPGMVE